MNFCKFVVFSILLRTQMVHLEVSFIIYSALFTPSFAVYFVRTFERLAKTFQCLKTIYSGYSRSYFNLFLIYAVACDARKIIQTFTYIKTVVIVPKDRLDTKILSQFSKLPDKNLLLILFYLLTSLKL